MDVNALAVANYFIELANKNEDEYKTEIQPLGLMKRVYIAHGFSLAIFGKSLLNPRYDKVEAWRYGPVIPSVYHTFKYLRDKNISMADRAVYQKQDGSYDYAVLEDCDAKRVCEAVWERYKGKSSSYMVEITHRQGSPWSAVYKEGQYIEIPDSYTKLYYTEILKELENKYHE